MIFQFYKRNRISYNYKYLYPSKKLQISSEPWKLVDYSTTTAVSTTQVSETAVTVSEHVPSVVSGVEQATAVAAIAIAIAKMNFLMVLFLLLLSDKYTEGKMPIQVLLEGIEPAT